MLRAVLLGRAAAVAAEGGIEAADRVEAGGEGDVDDAVARGGQQVLCVRDSVIREVVDEGGTEGLLEQAHGVDRMQADGARNLLRREPFGVALGDQAGHAFDLIQTDDTQGRPAARSRAP